MSEIARNTPDTMSRRRFLAAGAALLACASLTTACRGEVAEASDSRREAKPQVVTRPIHDGLVILEGNINVRTSPEIVNNTPEHDDNIRYRIGADEALVVYRGEVIKQGKFEYWMRFTDQEGNTGNVAVSELLYQEQLHGEKYVSTYEYPKREQMPVEHELLDVSVYENLKLKTTVGRFTAPAGAEIAAGRIVPVSELEATLQAIDSRWHTSRQH
jgi:hypothetical protein